jgi:hypothetical protein
MASDPNKPGMHLDVTQDRAALIANGPTIALSLRALLPDGSSGTLISNLLAQFDTGASRSCITLAVATKLGTQPSSVTASRIAGDQELALPTYKCAFVFPDGTTWATEIPALSYLGPPHDILIGRDLMNNSRLLVDFTTGKWDFRLWP